MPDLDCYVVLHKGTGPSANAALDSSLVVTDSSRRFLLRDDVWIERLDEQLARNIQQACEPPHFNITKVGYDQHLYAFVRRVPNNETRKYEGTNVLAATIALSRLINPTSTGDRYFARVFDFSRSDSNIQAIQFHGVSPDIILGNSARDWLSVSDGKRLRNLMRWVEEQMHFRVHRAFWNHEYVMRSLFLDMRWPLVVAGLEALISVSKYDLKKQFRERVFKLAGALQLKITKDELNKVYDVRSKLVHAEGFLHALENVMPVDEHVELYSRLEEILRSAVRRSLEDDSIGATFKDDAAIIAAWEQV